MNCLEILNLVKSRKELIKNHPKIYAFLLKNYRDLLNKLLPKYEKTDHFRWTLENTIEEAKKYQNRKEFRKNRKGAYQFLTKNYPEELNKVFPKKPACLPNPSFL